MDFPDQVGWGKMELQAPMSGAYINAVEIRAGSMDVGGERFFHPDGAAGTPYVSRGGQQFLHGDHVAFFVARYFCGLLEVEFRGAGDHADEMAGFVTLQHQRFEYLLHGLVELVGNVRGAEVCFVHIVGDQVVGNSGFVQ